MVGSGFARKLRKAADLTWSDWRELAISTQALLMARIVFARLPAKDLVARLQVKAPVEPRGHKQQGVEGYRQDQNLDAGIRRLEWAIGAAAAILPWRTDCLIRCLAADKILRRRGLAPEFYLGVNKPLNEGFGAHAWLRCRGIPVTGGESREFEVLIGPENS